MANPNASLPIARVFSNLFHGLPKLILTNLLFAIPTAVFFSLFYAINAISGLNSIFILLLSLIPVFPFFAGVVKISLHAARGDEDVAVFPNFVAAVLEIKSIKTPDRVRKALSNLVEQRRDEKRVTGKEMFGAAGAFDSTGDDGDV